MREFLLTFLNKIVQMMQLSGAFGDYSYIVK